MEDLVALVTGGGSGIGLAAAKMLVERGAKVMIVGRDSSKLKQAIVELNQPAEQVKTLSADVSSEGYANKVVVNTREAFGRLDILINNAGVFGSANLFDMGEEDFDYVVNGNLKATWFMCKFGGRVMAQNGGGSIVNVSSLLAVQSFPGIPSSAYSAAKGGIIALSHALAVELAPNKVRVNVVVPALVNTPMLELISTSESKEQMLEKAKRRYPLGRLGEPEDVARAIMYFVDPANSWVTGAELVVDGGIRST